MSSVGATMNAKCLINLRYFRYTQMHKINLFLAKVNNSLGADKNSIYPPRAHNCVYHNEMTRDFSLKVKSPSRGVITQSKVQKYKIHVHKQRGAHLYFISYKTREVWKNIIIYHKKLPIRHKRDLMTITHHTLYL